MFFLVFSSTVFLFIFLPFVYVIFLLAPTIKIKNFLLMLMSLVFYAFGEPVAVLLMLLSVLVNYFFGRCLSKEKIPRKVVLVSSVIFNLGMLSVFKYAGFFVEILNSVLPVDIPVPQISLPIGISFFTFQALSYVIDVYRGDAPVQKKFGGLLLYIAFFPQLIAGPIVRYNDIAEQLEERDITLDKTILGIQRFIVGLSKKLLIANTVGYVADTAFSLNSSEVSLPLAWLGAIAYVLQIYFDFSGYSDMAIGLGKIFGFEFKENFNYPYAAESMRDFWRRWHISVSGWFKEYLYIPLGGNRKGSARTCINKLIVFFFTGLWHGASVTFIVWGLYHGIFLMLEQYKIIPVDKIKFKLLKYIYTMLVVTVGFVIFRADTLSQAGVFIREMFTGFAVDSASFALFVSQLNPLFVCTALLGAVLCAPVVPWLAGKLKKESVRELACCTGSLILLGLCIINLSSATFNPFIYFRF